ncbi:MAG: exodeoxyribonuclease III [Gammaproteobacteria bacterium]|jgi:exodeoxyribonuclease-3
MTKQHHFTIATWNVNSLRVRLPQVLDWLKQHKPDVLVLQETKLPDTKFPEELIVAAKYNVVYAGQPTYNGVAILSRNEAQNIITDLPGLTDPQRRFLGADIDDFRILNLYVPNGSAVGSDKFKYKLQWLTKLRAYVKQQLKKHKRLIVLGDFNIALEDRDVYDPRAWAGQVLVSDEERCELKKLLKLGLVDAFRLFQQETGHYSWWDYRMQAFRRNHGLRLDLILINQALVAHCVDCQIDKAPRKLPQPSDHAPVIAKFTW